MPERIRRSRAKGWRMPAGARYVGRPGRWGNPFIVGRVSNRWCVYTAQPQGDWGDYATELEAQQRAVDLFELHTGPMGIYEYDDATLADLRRDLGGCDLVCWCAIDGPCHVVTLLRLANA